MGVCGPCEATQHNQQTTSTTGTQLDDEEKQRRQLEADEKRRQLEASRAPVILQISDLQAGIIGAETEFSAMLLGTVHELTAELMLQEVIVAGTLPEQVAVSFGGERVADPKSTTLEGLGVAEGGTLEIKVDGKAREVWWRLPLHQTHRTFAPQYRKRSDTSLPYTILYCTIRRYYRKQSDTSLAHTVQYCTIRRYYRKRREPPVYYTVLYDTTIL